MGRRQNARSAEAVGPRRSSTTPGTQRRAKLKQVALAVRSYKRPQCVPSSTWNIFRIATRKWTPSVAGHSPSEEKTLFFFPLAVCGPGPMTGQKTGQSKITSSPCPFNQFHANRARVLPPAHLLRPFSVRRLRAASGSNRQGKSVVLHHGEPFLPLVETSMPKTNSAFGRSPPQ